MVGGFNHLEKYDFVSWEDYFHILWKNNMKLMFQTTNQINLYSDGLTGIGIYWNFMVTYSWPTWNLPSDLQTASGPMSPRGRRGCALQRPLRNPECPAVRRTLAPPKRSHGEIGENKVQIVNKPRNIK
jgi:hypothetical protein